VSKRIRVGVVGHGHFGSFHAKHYEAHPDAELVAIADPTPVAAERVREAYDDRQVDDYRDLIGRVDAVSIAVPTALHETVAHDFIDAGIHVLVEKPLCSTAEAAERVTRFAAEKGVVLNVGHIEQFSAVYRR
jgi:predicted dehydrogenase